MAKELTIDFQSNIINSDCGLNEESEILQVVEVTSPIFLFTSHKDVD